jgi:hypothetical protein
LKLTHIRQPMLFAAASRVDKALRHKDPEARRRHLRLALEQFRQALRDIVSDRLFAADTPVGQVLANPGTAVSVPQKEFAVLLGVSTRQPAGVARAGRPRTERG